MAPINIKLNKIILKAKILKEAYKAIKIGN